jgi:hypothetical protein
MDEPSQPPVSSEQDKSDPYAFIMKEGGSNKLASKFSFKSFGTPAKLAMIGGGAIVFLILLSVGYNSFFSAPENSSLLSRVGRQQAHILQAAEMGVEKARSQTARNLSITTKLSLIDDQRSLKSALAGKNVRVSTSDDPELEQKLIIAEQANRFDEELLEYLQTELKSYADNLDAAYNTTLKTDKELRQVLAAQYKNARYLAGEGTPTSNGP